MITPVPRWYVLAVILVSALSVGMASIFYANHVARESERKWCSVVATIDSSYRATPPTTPTGKKLAADMAALRRELHCPAS